MQNLKNDKLIPNSNLNESEKENFNLIANNSDLTNLDNLALNALVQQYDTYQRATVKLKNEDYVINGKKNQWFTIQKQSLEEFIKLLNSLDLSSKSRASKILKSVKTNDPIKELMSDD